MNKTSSSRKGPRRKRILIVDDHPMMRYGIAQLISQQTDLEVCGEQQDAQGALAAVNASKPDLVLAELNLPGKSGLQLIHDLKTEHPDVGVLVLSRHDEAVYAERVLRSGARGYLMKSAGADTLIEALREDLYFRLNVIAVGMPPPRDRPEDLLRFAEHYAKHFGSQCDRNIDGFTDEAFQADPGGSSPRTRAPLRHTDGSERPGRRSGRRWWLAGLFSPRRVCFAPTPDSTVFEPRTLLPVQYPLRRTATLETLRPKSPSLYMRCQCSYS